MLNVLLNAIEALGSVAPARRELLLSASTGEKQIKVSVSDSGGGIAAEAVDRVFEAFYTTKPSGMGVGLSISRSIVEAHGGFMFLKPRTPRGTEVGFTLPQHPTPGD